MPGALWFWAALGAYGLAAAAYLGFVMGLKERASKMGLWITVLAFVLHTCEIGARGINGLHPVSSVRESVGFVAWLLVGGFLLAHIKWKIHTVGTFVAPAALVLLLTARLSPVGDSPGSTEGLGVLGRVHISLATAGVSIFAFATALATIYLFQNRQLKNKQFGGLSKKGVALETLDGLVHRCVQIGFPIFTVAMVTGAVWSAQRHGGALKPEYTVAMVAWTAFAALLIARVTAGWRGRRAALLTIVGFTCALIVLGIYLARHVSGV